MFGNSESIVKQEILILLLYRLHSGDNPYPPVSFLPPIEECCNEGTVSRNLEAKTNYRFEVFEVRTSDRQRKSGAIESWKVVCRDVLIENNRILRCVMCHR